MTRTGLALLGRVRGTCDDGAVSVRGRHVGATPVTTRPWLMDCYSYLAAAKLCAATGVMRGSALWICLTGSPWLRSLRRESELVNW